MQNKDKKLDEIIRVNHAGEHGAQVIYNSQIKFSKDIKLKKKLEKIAREELVHYDYFDEQIQKNRTRPTLMRPVWDIGGYALGFVTSVLGEKYVHACTEAVEEVIVEHYLEQIEYLKKSAKNKDIQAKIKQFCDEEENHKKYAAANYEEGNISVKIFKKFTREVTKAAIKISKKI